MATMTITDKDKFLLQLEGQDFSYEPKDLIKVREKALQNLKNLDFPSRRDEDWKYTSIRSISKGEFKPQSYVNISKEKLEKYFIKEDAYHLVFVNGVFEAKFSNVANLQKGLTLLNLNEAKKENLTEITPYFAKIASDNSAFFLNLNNAFSQDGLYVHVDKNVEIEKPVQVIHVNYGEDLCVMPRNLIVAEANSKLNLVSTYVSFESKNTFTNVVTEAYLKEGAQVFLDKIQLEENENANHIAYEQVMVEKNANFVINTVPLKGDLIRNNLNIKLLGPGCNADLYAPIVLNGNAHVDNQTFVEHLAPSCTSNELYKCVANDQSTNVFNGKILVDQIAQKTNAFQSNANVVLTDEAKVNSKPQLEIYADDVKCSHGCTIGQFDDEALFYLRSRGISKAKAQEVLLDAFVGEVVNNIQLASLKEFIQPYINANFKSAQES